MYPSRQDYQVALMAAGKLLLVPGLATARFEPDASGIRPNIWSGGFAAVFKCTDQQGRSWALRCPTQAVPGSDTQYVAVHDYWQRHPADYAVEFTYHREGIIVNGARYPVTLSRWIAGLDLRTFIRRHGASVALREAWGRVARDMVSRGIAHGDLQHENILIEGGPQAPRVRLVDYDSFVVPKNVGSPEPIGGVPNYQHPNRQSAVTTKHARVDAFSMLVLELSMLAVESHPHLWPELKHDRTDGIIIGQYDLREPDKSDVITRLRSCGGEIAGLCQALEDALAVANPLACPYPWEVHGGQARSHRSAAVPRWMAPAGTPSPRSSTPRPATAPSVSAAPNPPANAAPSWMHAAANARPQPQPIASSTPRPAPPAPLQASTVRRPVMTKRIGVTIGVGLFLLWITIAIVLGLN